MRHLTQAHRRSCPGKIKHGSRAAAEGARWPLGDGAVLQAYQCRCCGGWHLGNAVPPSMSDRATHINRLRLGRPLLKLDSAKADLIELRKGGYGVSLGVEQRLLFETIVSELRWWLEHE